MVIEWLKFRVERSVQARFLHYDRQIWTTALATCPGYHSKQVWRDAADPLSLIVVVHWTQRDLWKAIDPQWLADLEAQFQAAVGAGYTLQDAKEFSAIDLG